MSPAALERVLLVGFMGSGKTSVGRRVAEALDWRFLDFDDVIEAEEGATIADLFRDRGEAHFRALEARVAEQLLSERHVVLGSGGGWAAAAPGRLREVPAGTATFWLRVSAEEVLRRAARQPGQRPLLDRPDPLEAARELISRREPRYGEASWTVDTEGRSVEDVTAGIVEILAREYPQLQVD